MRLETKARSTANDVAIIGMAGRFPGADDVSSFWDALVAGKETTKTFDEADLVKAGLPPGLLKEPNYVPKRGVLSDIEGFDAGFFSYSPREAEVLDPQQRVFLECAWTAMEDAGYDPQRCTQSVGVFSGSNMNSYLLFHLLHSDEALSQVHSFGIANEKDFLSTRVSYKLNLSGPSMSVQCACSTSLVCVHLACQSIIGGDCDMALAGGVSVVFPQAGYFYQPGGVFSPDGHCRPFDHRATGTYGSDGAGVVLLKRFDDAIRDGDQIYATILATSVNNDGADKASFAAPSLEGQVRVVADAFGLAGVDPATIGYVEAHGTGTPLGDPIEVTALSKVFRAGGAATGSCALGSLKSNFGHLDQAAGVANLIKAALVLKHGIMPPTLNFERANSLLNIEETSFRVNSSLTAWPDSGGPRRACVSSFGFGGTNAHAILEGPPPTTAASPMQRWEVLPLSAKTDSALERCTQRLATHFESNPDICLADAAHVLQTGRSQFPQRSFLVARSTEDAAAILCDRTSKRLIKGTGGQSTLPVFFMFPGQGSQFCSMGSELYQSRAVFRDQVDLASEMLRDPLGMDLRSILFPTPGNMDAAQELIGQTRFTQPALFVIEYALAKLWMSCGLEPRGLIGHSIGEYVAACLSGVFSLADALRLVSERARLMQTLPPGNMLTVSASRADLRDLLSDRVALAALNGPRISVLAMSAEDLAATEKELHRRGYSFQKLRTSHAFHSHLIEPILDRFREVVDAIPRSQPTIPFVSNVTGEWITPEEALSADYWCRHLRQSVRFADGISTLLRNGRCGLLEVGPGKTLATLARNTATASDRCIVVNSMPSAKSSDSEEETFLKGLGSLWANGAEINWKSVSGAGRRRISLPGYSFERSYYFVPPRRLDTENLRKPAKLARNSPDKWAYLPAWSRVPLASPGSSNPGPWLVLTDDQRLRNEFGRIADGQQIIWTNSGEEYSERVDGSFVVRPEKAQDFEHLLSRLAAIGRRPQKVVLAWETPWAAHSDAPDARSFRRFGVDSLFALAQGILRADPVSLPIEIVVVTFGAQDVSGSEAIHPGSATVLGPCLVISQEHPHICCRNLDWSADAPISFVEQLIAELRARESDTPIAYRGRIRFKPNYQPLTLSLDRHPDSFSAQDVVLITGGFGEVGLTLAESLVATYKVKVALVGRSELPPIDRCTKWQQEHSSDDPIANALLRVRALIHRDAQIYMGTADVANREQMERVLAEVRSCLGPVTCVVHAAGISGPCMFQSVSRTTPEDLDLHFRAKVDGVRCLAEVLANQPELKAVILQSSLFGTLGGPGCAAACAATLFMDRMCAEKQRVPGGPHWISIGWDAWMPRHAASPDPTGLSIHADEVLPVLEAILDLKDVACVVVSTCSLESRRERWSDSRDKDKPHHQTGLSTYERPNLPTQYAAPESEIQAALAELWQELIGVTQVGIHDDFFELGGHSLLAILIIGRIKETFPVEVDFADVVESPTIAGLSQLIEARLIAKLESMSEEDTSELLEEMLQPGSLQAAKEASERYTVSN